jgi:hypothetical protein
MYYNRTCAKVLRIFQDRQFSLMACSKKNRTAFLCLSTKKNLAYRMQYSRIVVTKNEWIINIAIAIEGVTNTLGIRDCQLGFWTVLASKPRPSLFYQEVMQVFSRLRK